MKIYNIKEERENIEREVPIYVNDLKERIIIPGTYVLCIQMNTKRCVENQEEIKGLLRKIIKIDLGIQEIKNELTNIKLSNTMIMENLKKLYYNNWKIQSRGKDFTTS